MPQTLPSLQVFIEGLIKEKGLEDLDPEILTQLKEDLQKRLENIINATILENLPSEKLPEFEKLLDSGADDEMIQSFCRENIPNLDEVIAKALLDFRRSYLVSG